MVVPRFVQAALKNEAIEVHGDGTQSRCFGHVTDVVEGLVKALENPACFGQVINFGSDAEVTINDLAKRAIELTNSQSEIRYIPYGEVYGDGFEDMQRRVPSLEKARRLVGYQPTRNLDDIINDVADELRDAAPSTFHAKN
jgi:UDP-glucose 4-epimerase